MLKINLNCTRDWQAILNDLPHTVFIFILAISKNLSMNVKENDFDSSFIVVVVVVNTIAAKELCMRKPRNYSTRFCRL